MGQAQDERGVEAESANRKECPLCAMFNPVDALGCNCGYDFQTGKVVHRSYVPLAPDRATQGLDYSTGFFCSISIGGGVILSIWYLARGFSLKARQAITISASTVLALGTFYAVGKLLLSLPDVPVGFLMIGSVLLIPFAVTSLMGQHPTKD